MGLLKSILISAGTSLSGLCSCEDAEDAGRSCVCCRSVPQSSSDSELWLLNWAAGEGAALCTCPCGVSAGSSESPWGAALPWSTFIPPPSLGLSGRLSSVLPVFFKTSKRTTPSTGCSTWTCPSLLAELGRPKRQENKKQMQLGKCKLWSCISAKSAAPPGLGPGVGTVPVPSLQLCQHSLFLPSGISCRAGHFLASARCGWPFAFRENFRVFSKC